MKTANKYTGVWKYCSVYKILRCLSKNRLCTKMLIIHLFSIFTIKTLWVLAGLEPLDLLIMKTLTNVLLLLLVCLVYIQLTLTVS